MAFHKKAKGGQADLALLGHTIFGQGLARLAVWLPPVSGRGHVLHHTELLHFTPAQPAEASLKVLQRANAIYAGHADLGENDYLALEWLATLAASGRQLLLCHGLRLLESWNQQHRAPQSVSVESTILDKLVFSAGQAASLLQPQQMGGLALAFQNQINRLVRLRTRDASETRIKALALLAAADRLRDGLALRNEALRLLEQALPDLINSDGGPVVDSLPDFAAWLQPLLQREDLCFLPDSRNALDRVRPFLSMLLDANQRYCFAPALDPVSTVVATAPLRLAPISRVGRLAGGKTVVIMQPSGICETSAIHVSGNGQVLLEAGLFQHGPDDDQSVLALTHQAADAGQLLQQQVAGQQRTVFLSAKGDDLRIEECMTVNATPNWMRLSFHANARISVARNGTQATIALDSRNLWQLTLRGATLVAPSQGNMWLARTTATRINWALKRINRPNAKARKPETQQLPF